MSDTYYPSKEKLGRAKDIVANFDLRMSQKPALAVVKLVINGKAEKLEGEALVDYVYKGLGGAPKLEGAKAVEAKDKEVKSKVKAKKGRAHKESEIIVK